MSVTKFLTAKGTSRLVIPSAGKMFRSNITKDNKALCFVINKGYLETVNLTDMLDLVDFFQPRSTIILVGGIEKIRLSNSRDIVYRQRVFFKSLNEVLDDCKFISLKFDLADNFRVGINSIMNCTDELIFLERYASEFSETIDDWLTHCCIIHVHYFLVTKNMYTGLAKKVNKILQGKRGYLNRAPLLVSSYNIDRKSSGIFINFDIKDNRLYDGDGDFLGYTTKNVHKDIKGGAFK